MANERKCAAWLKPDKIILELGVRSAFPDEYKIRGQRGGGYLMKNWVLLGRGEKK